MLSQKIILERGIFILRYLEMIHESLGLPIGFLSIAFSSCERSNMWILEPISTCSDAEIL